jgi:hypothetical protein
MGAPIIKKLLGKKPVTKKPISKSVTSPRAATARTGVDRRSKSRDEFGPSRRSRIGFWLQYHRVTRAGEFDDVELDHRFKLILCDHLLPEANKFLFRDRDHHAIVPPNTALNSAIDHIWANPADARNPNTNRPAAVYLIEAIAEYLVKSYDIVRTDRRKSERRAGAAGTS